MTMLGSSHSRRLPGAHFDRRTRAVHRPSGTDCEQSSARSPASGYRVFLLLALSACLLAARHANSAETVRTAAQVRSLTVEQAEKHLDVHIKGVVTYYDEGLYSRFIQDETAGIYLREMTNMPALQPGQFVEVEGQTGAGEYAPVVIPRSVKVLGAGAMPPAKPGSLEQPVSGRAHSHFV